MAEFESLPEDEQKAIYGAYKAINETPGVSPGLQLQPPETATTVRVQDGKTLTTDGPFVEIKEAIGGYLLFEAENLDAAIETSDSSSSSPPVIRHSPPTRRSLSPCGRSAA